MAWSVLNIIGNKSGGRMEKKPKHKMKNEQWQ